MAISTIASCKLDHTLDELNRKIAIRHLEKRALGLYLAIDAATGREQNPHRQRQLQHAVDHAYQLCQTLRAALLIDTGGDQ